MNQLIFFPFSYFSFSWVASLAVIYSKFIKEISCWMNSWVLDFIPFHNFTKIFYERMSTFLTANQKPHNLWEFQGWIWLIIGACLSKQSSSFYLQFYNLAPDFLSDSIYWFSCFHQLLKHHFFISSYLIWSCPISYFTWFFQFIFHR
jgi:hypothetical protein